MATAYEIAAVDASFSELGQPITYTFLGGSFVTVVGLLTRPDGEYGIAGSRVVLEDIDLEVRQIDIALPSPGDLFTASGIDYRVTGTPMIDEAGLVWTCSGARV